MSIINDVVISFDTTGSMQRCIAAVRKNVEEIVTKLFQEVPDIRIGIVGMGDYCDGPNLMKFTDLCNDVPKLIDFIKTVPNTGGGDAPEAYEYVLREVQKFAWRPEASKILVMIGDANPHPVNENPHKIDWKEECHKLKNMNVRIYSVQAFTSEDRSAYDFYDDIGTITGGDHLFLYNFEDMPKMMIDICHGITDLSKYKM
ncbi:VWa domain-containing protein [Fadolivirus algeromassiliense]|uniref:VWa domain-containing protein n=1 Tax=Fadolivirus FV1/VV64 TaxID=3070911 RepID=A0A7D3UWI7_9VIRU|nr:VWa domain-containing protein [Fadolivirus algeromassiliense]QKF94849.1 VWa domain-containing protein [Fadolivirus FV1/VV64]